MTISYKASKSPYLNESFISTGLPKLDGIIGGGIPRGRITQFVGNKSTGKTTLALTMIRDAQKNGLKCVVADVENALNFRRAEELGVDLDNLIVMHGSYGEEYLEEIETIINKGAADVIFIDSLAALEPKEMYESTGDQKFIGAHARMCTKFLRHIIIPLRKKNIALVIINHIMLDIMSGQERSPGGKSLEFYTSVMVHMRPHAQNRMMQGEVQIGTKYHIKIKKNKMAAPFRECDISLLFDSGYSAEADLLEEMILDGRITKEGRSYFMDGQKVATSQAAAREFIKTLGK